MHVDRLLAVARDKWPVPGEYLTQNVRPFGGKISDPEERSLYLAARRIEKGWGQAPFVPEKVLARYARLITSLTVDPSPFPVDPTETL